MVDNKTRRRQKMFVCGKSLKKVLTKTLEKYEVLYNFDHLSNTHKQKHDVEKLLFKYYFTRNLIPITKSNPLLSGIFRCSLTFDVWYNVLKNFNNKIFHLCPRLSLALRGSYRQTSRAVNVCSK